MVLTLEGGYDLTALRESVKSVLMEMINNDGWIDRGECQKQEKANYKDIEKGIESIQKIQREYWPCF
jgi:hypothetical protein